MIWAILLTWASCAFASGGEIKSSFASNPGEFAANHGVTLAELADHSLLTCWYAGSRKGGKDVQIYCRRQIANGTWLERTVAVAAGERTSGNLLHNKSVGNPALYRDIDGVLWLFYSSVRIGGWAGGHVNYKTSHDDGAT